MFAPFSFSESDYHFLHGWSYYDVNGQDSYGFTGGGVSAIRIFPESELTIILFTTGYKYYPIHNQIINTVAGVIDLSLKDDRNLLLQSTLVEYIRIKKQNSESIYNELASNHPEIVNEAFFNQLGYRLLSLFQYQSAIEIFELNTQNYSDSYNVFDSLGEAYLYVDRWDDAINSYEKSLELNPNNHNAKRMIKMIESRK